MRTRNGFRPCPKCNGSGEIVDPVEQGRKMRALRTASGKTLREVARVVRHSPAYISDLELGRRGWNQSLIEKYKAAVRA